MSNHVVEMIVAIGVLSIIGFTIVKFVSVITDYRLKKRMIEKELVNEEVQGILKNHAIQDKFAALKWGMIIFFAGLSFIIMHMLDTDPETPLPYGIFAVFVSFGFLIYYFITRNERK